MKPANDVESRRQRDQFREELKTFVLDLLMCPFCGAIPEIMPWHGGGPRKTAVSCENEYCPGHPSTVAETPEEAVERWNTRAP